jgi:DNA-binding transcriptional ArsR family regulator
MNNTPMDASEFLKQYADSVAPRLTPYEQAIYLYAIRHSRLLGLVEITIGFNAAARRGLFGLGRTGSSRMSPHACRDSLRSLQEKGLVSIISSDHDGFRIGPLLPSEVPGMLPTEKPELAVDPLALDFFEFTENRELILQREGHKCFYCLRSLDERSFVIEHVRPREEAGNGFQNVVAACRDCNNKKGRQAAEEYLRQLYRMGLVTQLEFEDRSTLLADLLAGRLVPDVSRARTA